MIPPSVNYAARICAHRVSAWSSSEKESENETSRFEMQMHRSTCSPACVNRARIASRAFSGSEIPKNTYAARCKNVEEECFCEYENNIYFQHFLNKIK